VHSLAQAKVNPLLRPFLVYDDSIRAREPTPTEKPVGFVMYQIMDGVGFIMRLMIDPAFQGQGYGFATMVEVIRRFKMMPEIEYIGTSVLKTNHVAHDMYRKLGFVDGTKLDEREYYLRLDWDPKS
jgi:diamine N-acetyltransferase